MPEEKCKIHLQKRELKTGSFQVQILQTFLQEIQSKSTSLHSGIVQLKDPVPAFMQTFYDVPGPIIVVSAKFRVGQQVAATSSKLNGKEECNKPLGIKLEVTGNPLEVPFTAEDKYLIENPNFPEVDKDEAPQEIFHPISNEEARMVQMKYTQALPDLCKRNHVNPEDLLAVVFICDGSDAQKMVLMLSVALTSKRASACKEDKCLEEGLEHARLRALKQCQSKAFVQFKNNHPPKVDCIRYLEHSKIMLSDDGAVLNEDCQFKLRTLWKEKRHDLDSNPPPNAACTLEAVLNANWDTWFMGYLADEVRLLVDLALLLGVHNQALTPVPGGPEEIDLFDSATSIVQQSRRVRGNVNPNTMKENVEEPLTLEKLVNDTNSKMRPNTDLTDCVWNTLKYCETAADINTGLIAVLQECSVTEPSIMTNNMTQVAKSAQQVSQTGEKQAICLLLDPIRLLLEVGYTKLSRDFVYICQGSGLMTAEDARAACEGDASGDIKDWSQDEWQKRVSHMHYFLCCLEIVLRASKQFAFKLGAMRAVLKSALSTKIGSNLKVNLYSEEFSNMLQSSEACLRRWTFRCTNDRTKGTCTTYFVTRPYSPFFPWAFPITSRVEAVANADPNSTLLSEKGSTELFCATIHYLTNY